MSESFGNPLAFDGQRYRHASAHQTEWGRRIIDQLDLEGSERVLDVGCGDGRLTAQIGARLPRGEVLGIDASPSMISAAQSERAAHVHFRLLDVRDVAFQEEFDVVFSNASLHWLPDHRPLLLALHGCLVPGEVLRAAFGAEGNCSTWFRVARELMSEPEFVDEFNDFVWPYYMPSIESYSKLAAESPFREVRVWGESADRFFPDREAMLRWLAQPAILPFMNHLSEERAARFHQVAAEKMVRATLRPDGTCFESFRRLNVWARK